MIEIGFDLMIFLIQVIPILFLWYLFKEIKYFLGGYGFEIFDTVSLDDRFYTFGGYWKNGTYGDHVYQFKDFQWSLAGQMLGARGASFAVRFDREIFIIGGYPIEILEPDHEFYPV